MSFHASLLFTLPWDNPLASRFDVAKIISMCAVYLRRKIFLGFLMFLWGKTAFGVYLGE